MTRPIRVAHVVPALFGEDDGIVGGAERYVFELARHMADRVPTTLVSFARQARQERVGNLQIRILGGAWHVRGQRTNPFSFGLFRAVKDATVIHCYQQHVFASSTAALFARGTGRRAFVTELGGGGWDVSAYVSTDRWFHGHLHISEYSRRVSEHDARPWAHVIYGGVDTEKFSPPPTPLQRETALFVGRILPHKGVDYLVEASEPGLAVTVIGPPCDSRYRAYLSEAAKGKPVVFRDAVDDVDLVKAYRSALCIVLPSVYRTTFGRTTRVPELLGQTLLEGMACEAPAVCTDVASMPEVVTAGETGFVVPPNDAMALRERIRWLSNHPREARAMGRRARERVLERFTWPTVVERCLALYGSPLAKREHT